MNKKEILAYTLDLEGGYSNDIDDAGGETYAGISRNNFPDWYGWTIIDDLKDEINFPKNIDSDFMYQYVENFYSENFFIPLKLDEIHSNDVAMEIFDTAVNCGKSKAIKILQRALNLLNKNEKLFDDLKIDGSIGNKTIQATNEILRFTNGASKLIKALNGLQFMHYVEITEKNPVYEKYFNGWLNRV